MGGALAAFSADVVVVLHIGYLLYAAFGGFLALRGMSWLWLHLASSVWSVTVTVTAIRCPLTAIEKWLISASGSTPYGGTFIEEYLTGIVYPVAYEAAVWFGGAAIALTSYAVVFAHRRAARAALPA
ncbi:MAG: DUF2784 domain-containing protein [Actinomycetes bacterium]